MTPKHKDHYRLIDQYDEELEKVAPSDGAALSWACGVLMKREAGEYTLSFIGPVAAEPLYRFRKNSDGSLEWAAL